MNSSADARACRVTLREVLDDFRRRQSGDALNDNAKRCIRVLDIPLIHNRLPLCVHYAFLWRCHSDRLPGSLMIIPSMHLMGTRLLVRRCLQVREALRVHGHWWPMRVRIHGFILMPAASQHISIWSPELSRAGCPGDLTSILIMMVGT